MGHLQNVQFLFFRILFILVSERTDVIQIVKTLIFDVFSVKIGQNR
jgi:hypothetical protein